MFGRGPAAERWSPTGETPSGLSFPRECKGEFDSLRRFAKREEAIVAAERFPLKREKINELSGKVGADYRC